MLEDFDYSFSENGLVAYKKGELVGRTVSPLSPRSLFIIHLLCWQPLGRRALVKERIWGGWRILLTGTAVSLIFPALTNIYLAQTINDHLGEASIKRLVNWTLRYLSDVDIPIKRYDHKAPRIKHTP